MHIVFPDYKVVLMDGEPPEPKVFSLNAEQIVAVEYVAKMLNGEQMPVDRDRQVVAEKGDIDSANVPGLGDKLLSG